MNEYEIIEFKNDIIELSVNVSPKEDTVWLTKEQMAILFGRDRSVISKHINNILKERELDDSTCAFFAHVQKEVADFIANTYGSTVSSQYADLRK